MMFRRTRQKPRRLEEYSRRLACGLTGTQYPESDAMAPYGADLTRGRGGRGGERLLVSSRVNADACACARAIACVSVWTYPNAR